MEYGLDFNQFKRHIVAPILSRANVWSQAAENLVLGTACVESRLRYVDQIDAADKPGPAYGLFQMEGATHDDIHINYLRYIKGGFALHVHALASASSGNTPFASEMVWNLGYATIMCRMAYMRVRERLPSADDALALANYHKKYYNTYLGKTKVEESVKHFEYVIRRSKEGA